ncbi:STAS domain-containing protein [Actinacidiphila acididurans]|uniref:STAS domain-containing protein n=1 Tax=Actinacidiphila acididurans TaxID=2784346 RepID=A0ABS2U1S5_9ACTN|nr:STAS domain-containing protein [Actinacidiphila acididurans]MBM9508691.1 STAS domain-containing protein [Actinacidiphila acididurans]
MTGQQGGAARVVRAGAELDWEGSQEFARQVRDAVDSGGAGLVVDLSAVAFADSSALHVLLEAHRDLADGGGRLVLAGPLRPEVDRLFEVTMTAGHFEFADDVRAALRALDSGRGLPTGTDAD